MRRQQLPSRLVRKIKAVPGGVSIGKKIKAVQ
jgi:hypothetical protein